MVRKDKRIPAIKSSPHFQLIPLSTHLDLYQSDVDQNIPCRKEKKRKSLFFGCMYARVHGACASVQECVYAWVCVCVCTDKAA